jgi:CheY-like chemotaxis protein/phosphoribosyl 1,2-cyclic phosphodiesterase
MPKSKAKPRILVAEDVRAISMRITHVLQSRGYEVEVATDGEQCLALIAAKKPDLVILDLMMPRLNGMEVLKRLRASAETRDMPVIICTAKDFSTEMKQVRELGIADVIIKPFDHDTLAQKVDRCFNRISDVAAPAEASPAAATEMYAPTLETGRARVILWGTRGSIPVSGARYVRYGGNTSCMEYACGNDQIVFDAGSGIRDCATSLLSGGPRHLHLFITHTHWDHIQGFPFFTPIYIPGYEITIYGERGFGKNYESLLSGQLDRDYFPIQREDLRAKLNFRFLDDEPIFIGDIKVTREFTHHPGATVAFKIEHQGRKIAYVPDNEFLHGYLGPPQDIARDSELVIPQEPMVDFLTGVDLMLHEAQYLAPEYSKKIGWGHSNLANACVLAKLAAVKKWIVIHHDPAHDDTFLDNKLSLTRQILGETGCTTEVQHGHDGMVEYL